MAFWDGWSNAQKLGALGGVGVGAFLLMRARSGGAAGVVERQVPLTVLSDDSIYAERGGPLPIYIANASDISGGGTTPVTPGPGTPGTPGTPNTPGRGINSKLWERIQNRAIQTRTFQHRRQILKAGGITKAERSSFEDYTERVKANQAWLAQQRGKLKGTPVVPAPSASKNV